MSWKRLQLVSIVYIYLCLFEFVKCSIMYFVSIYIHFVSKVFMELSWRSSINMLCVHGNRNPEHGALCENKQHSVFKCYRLFTQYFHVWQVFILWNLFFNIALNHGGIISKKWFLWNLLHISAFHNLKIMPLNFKCPKIQRIWRLIFHYKCVLKQNL